MEVLTVPHSNFMAVKMQQDTVTHSYQFAQAFMADGTPKQFPVPYFPLLYQGHEYLIFPTLDTDVTRLSFNPFSLEGTPIDLIVSTSTLNTTPQ